MFEDRLSTKHIVVFFNLLLINANNIEAGASSTPKNLVNLYTHSPNDNLTSFNQFQNEYQYRQAASKPAASDRYKSTTLPSLESIFEHLPTDLGDAVDYYQENKASTNIPECKGRMKLNNSKGFIIDGPGFYHTNLQCIWLIDSGGNATIRIQLHQFNTECNYDYLYIFDGDSVFSPLVAALSGDMEDFIDVFADSGQTSMISNSSDAIHKTAITSARAVPAVSHDSQVLELRTYSGKAFIYFHSDTAQTMPGFYITYSFDSCPLDCSHNGVCDYSSLLCRCNAEFYGDGCQYQVCPNNCTALDRGRCEDGKSCKCNPGFSGTDCSIKSDEISWNRIVDTEAHVVPRAFHQAVVVEDIMWIIGGKTQAFSNTNLGIFRRKPTTAISAFDIKRRRWINTTMEVTTNVDHIAELSGHSASTKGYKIFIFGGLALNQTILNTLTVFDTRTYSLSNIPHPKKPKSSEDTFTAPVAVVGHSSIIIDSHMYVFFGFNPLYGYINSVQKFNLANNSWSFAERKGSSVVGLIGHTSTFDEESNLVFIYGGLNAHYSNNLYSFDPLTESWSLLHSSPLSRYYHSAVILNRQLVVLAGNNYNSSHPTDQCFRANYLTYDLKCALVSKDIRDSSSVISGEHNCDKKCWNQINESGSNILKRIGQSLIRHNNDLILFGGFNGILRNDLRIIRTQSCENLKTEFDCLREKSFSNCYWNAIDNICVEQATNGQNSTTFSPDGCSRNDLKTLQHSCESRETCTDCLSTRLGCVWCSLSSKCSYSKCKNPTSKPLIDSSLCLAEEFVMNLSFGKKLPINQGLDNELECKRLDNCYLCHSRSQCSWHNEGCTFNIPNVISSPTLGLGSVPQDESLDMFDNNSATNSNSSLSANSSNQSNQSDINRTYLASFAASLLNSPYHSCDVPCYMRRSCNECTTTKCIWCSTTEQCIDSSAYFAYYPTGQCMHYVAHMLKCSVASCSDIETCDKCLTNPRCGWLNDISNTGKGKCIEGNSQGPSAFELPAIGDSNSNSTNISPIINNWFYTSCPSCQCNGHSYCKSNSSICVQTCQDNTEGLHCERCIHGYYGDPVNGGSCKPCRCNGHAQACNRETGKCYCSTKGIIGHNCNRCDDQNHYIGDPSSPDNGTCYYNLTTDYQYTFNMSKQEDHFYSDINFINVPFRKDSDVDFTIACSRLALVNITAGINYKNRKPIHSGLECGSQRLRFSHDRHTLTETNYSFFVHVYKFQTPLILQIAFSQHRTLYLPQFFFTFSSCFLFFFALSGLVWKLKHEYDLYVRRQRQFIEMEQMASRPFSTILLEIFKPNNGKNSTQDKIPAEPTPISFEPCFGSNVGVLSLFVQLPGRPNLAIGSALVSLNDDFHPPDEDGTIKNQDKERT